MKSLFLTSLYPSRLICLIGKLSDHPIAYVNVNTRFLLDVGTIAIPAVRHSIRLSLSFNCDIGEGMKNSEIIFL